MSRSWGNSSSMLWSPPKYLFYVEQYFRFHCAISRLDRYTLDILPVDSLGFKNYDYLPNFEINSVFISFLPVLVKDAVLTGKKLQSNTIRLAFRLDLKRFWPILTGLGCYYPDGSQIEKLF